MGWDGMNKGLIYPSKDVFPMSVPQGNTSGRKAAELRWPSASMSGFGGI